MPTPEPAPTNSPFTGQVLARCKIGTALGRGRTSWVCAAHYEPLDKEIAIKILSGDLAETAELRENFLAEARAVAKLDHANVVRVYDVVEDGEHLCILMEHIGGGTLQDRLQGGKPLPVNKALRIAREMAEALAAAHAEKIVHRDVKPGNVMLSGKNDVVKMVDFGLAGPKTLANRAGTPLYMSPEACQGKRIDEKSDVYALGVCLYQMLTGKLPYTGNTVREILAAHVKADLAPPSTVASGLGSKYDDLIRKLMVPAKGYRPTATEALALLAPFLETATPRDEGRRAAAGARKRRARTQRQQSKKGLSGGAIAGIVGVVLIGGAAIVMLGGDGDEPPVVDPNGGGAATTTTPITPATTTPTTTPVVPPPQEDPAEQAFRAADSWFGMNGTEFDEAIKRFEKVAADHQGTSWAARAKKRADEARDKLEQKKELDAARVAREESETRNVTKREEVDKLLAGFQFGKAAQSAKPLRNKPGETMQEWRAKRRRIQLLDQEFLTRINEGVSENQVMAKVLKPDAGHDEVVTGADETGIQTKAGDLPRTIPWSSVEPNAMFKFFKKFTSERAVDNNVFLAVMCAEIGLAKRSKNYREVAELVDSTGTAKERVREYFPE